MDDIIVPYQAKMTIQNHILPIFYSITCFVGVIGNSTIIYIIFFKPAMKTVPNLLIVNLSLGDMVFIFGHILFTIPPYVLETFPGGNAFCRLMVFIKYSTLGVSIFTLTFMAVDRLVIDLYDVIALKYVRVWFWANLVKIGKLS